MFKIKKGAAPSLVREAFSLNEVKIDRNCKIVLILRSEL